MHLYHHHFKKDDSFMWIDWVNHDGFGIRPRLSIRKEKNGLFFYFCFTCWKLNWYRVKPLKKQRPKPPRREQYTDLNDWLKAVSNYNKVIGY